MPATDLPAALAVDNQEWAAELPLIEQWFATIGDKLPGVLAIRPQRGCGSSARVASARPMN